MFLNPNELENKILYHYTTPEGLLGILQSDSVKLRLTKASALNDMMEGKILKERYKSVCTKLYREGKMNKKEYEFLMENTKLDNNGELKESEYRKMYICSFSLERDSLPMWNYYVKGGGYQGYNIGFQNPFIWCELSDNYLIHRFLRICKVEYSEEILESLLMECIDSVHKSPEYFGEIYGDVYSALSWGALEHKLECFSHEKEIRLIYTASDEDEEKIQYRTKNGVLIPYIEIPFFKETVKEITIGPLVERELAVENLKEFLDLRGYKNIDIKVSNVPIRY